MGLFGAQRGNLLTLRNRAAIIHGMTFTEYVDQHGQTATAALLGVSQGLVWQWVNGKTRITAERAKQIEEATQGAVNRRDVRPDIFS